MIKSYTSFLLFSIIVLLFNACYTPQAVVRLAPESTEHVFWYNGQAIAEQEQEGIIARTAFSHANKNYLIFDVEVFNEGEDPILVTPEIMELSTPGEEGVRAANPEHILLSMEIEASRQDANAKNTAIAGGIIAVGAIVAAIALDNDDGGNNDNDIENYTSFDATVDVVSTIAWGLSFRQNSILSVAAEELPDPAHVVFWDDIALRRTTLYPGEHIRGLVAFPRVDYTAKLNILIPIEQLAFTFNFSQRLYQP